jgi:hypothetical protein
VRKVLQALLLTQLSKEYIMKGRKTSSGVRGIK